MTAGAGDVVLYPAFDTGLHGSGKGPIHRRTQNEQIADMDGSQKIDMVAGSRDHITARMAMRRHVPGDVDEVHQSSAKQIPHRIRVVAHNHLSHFSLSS